jgi:glycosyltransferase involved in cell wall biosynthesis
MWYLGPHIRAQRNMYDITLVANGSIDEIGDLGDGGVRFILCPFNRKMSLFQDLLALIRLWQLFRRERFDIVHSVGPKAGLIAMLAAVLVGVPLRFHTFTGQVWANRSGFFKKFLQFIDKVIIACTSQVLADSPSQRRFLINHGIVNEAMIRVLGDGSISGVDVERFCRNDDIRQTVRAQHRIPHDALVLLFVGRLAVDKGLQDLSSAFAAQAFVFPQIHLMIIGPDEDGLDAEFAALARRYPGRVHRVGFTSRPEDFMSASDIFCLPSYREGFGNVIIEAAAAGIPTIASRIYGITDAVEEGVTGLLYEAGSVEQLGLAISLLTSDMTLRFSMGKAAKVRAISRFSQERIVREWIAFYQEKHRELLVKQ